MAFSKTFPKTSDKSAYPKWVEVKLSEQEEKQAEEASRQHNISLMKECIEDARAIAKGVSLRAFQNDMINIAIALFEKRASHSIYWKEKEAKAKFEKD